MNLNHNGMEKINFDKNFLRNKTLINPKKVKIDLNKSSDNSEDS